MRFRYRLFVGVPRVAAVVAASVATSGAFAQLNMRSMPPEFTELTEKHLPNIRFETGPATTISTYSFFPQIDNWVWLKSFSPENPNPATLKFPGIDNTLIPGGTTGRATALASALFPGQTMQGGWPPDPHMAVGPSHVVQVVNSSIAFYDKSDGMEIFKQRFTQFFATATTETRLFDPRVFYDQHNDRFIALALAVPGDRSVSEIVVAASDDSDPNGNWNFLNIDALTDVGGEDHWFDYPMPGYNADALVINGNLFGVSSGGFGGSQSFVIPTAGLYSGAGVTVTGFTLASPSSIQGAGNMGSSATNIYGMAVQNGGSMRLFAWGDLTTTPTMVSTTVGVPNFSFTTGAPTRGGSILDTISWRVLDANYRDGFMVGAHTVGVTSEPTRARIQWYEFDMGTWPTTGLPTLSQSGEIVLPGSDYAFQPAINKNVFGDISILFTRSSTNITADAMIASRVVTDPDGTLGQPLQIATSIGTWTLRRWGDYFAVVTDPGDDATFWGNGEIINATGLWTTEIQSWTVTIGGGGNQGTNYDAIAIAANKFPASGNTYPELIGTHFAGALIDMINSDNGFFDVDSAFLPGQGHYGSLRANFLIAEPASTVDELGITIESHVSPGRVAVGTLFAFNWSINSYQYVKVFAIKATDNDKRVIKIKKNPGDFVSSGGEVKLLIRAHDPFKRRGRNPEPFRLRVDLFGLNVKVL